ncbi:ABC transporter ATP-binding protein [Thioclava indica]|uniref:ABC transporter ATP-binding protein n=1 Tax=Thioclava indica TaxID=1353528 RepID=A0A074JVG2_9RHOB|nr:ABC transporter ATP-binding protein [Thioclava indica]KEO59895.1 hypothetical protein DT23_15640 [Thioclava indica]
MTDAPATRSTTECAAAKRAVAAGAVDAGVAGIGSVMQSLREIFAGLGATGRGKFWIALVLMILSGLTEGFSILLLLPVLKVILADGSGAGRLNLGDHHIAGFSLPDVSISLPVLLASFVSLVVVQVLFNRSKTAFMSDLLFDFTNQCRLSLFSALARARWDKITRMSGSELEHALTGEVERISTCGYYLLMIVQGIVMLLIYLIMSALVSLPMTLVMIIFGVIALTIMRPFRHRAARFGTLLQESRRRQFGTVSDFLGGLKSVRATNSEQKFYREFETLLYRNKHDAGVFARQNATGSGIFQIMITLGAATFILVAVTWLHLSFARLVVMLLVAMRIAPRFLGLQAQFQQLLQDLSAWRHVSKLRDDLVKAVDTSVQDHSAPVTFQHEIRLENVVYHYVGGAQPSLDTLSLSIEAGRVTALIGASGSGKSTVADLVTGLIRPQSGALYLDDRVLQPSELRGWRDRVAYVAQDNFLMNLSLRENLTALTQRECADDDLWQALDLAYASGFVRRLPDGLESLLGDRGVQLSGGERQRIALARAFLRLPDFLVLDEATSALDWEAQEHIAASVKKMARAGMTILTIAHRPSMVAFADQVYALESGRLIEAGTAEDLLSRKNGVFWTMMQKELTQSDT